VQDMLFAMPIESSFLRVDDERDSTFRTSSESD
jgi:hypothetical protein